MEEKVIGIIRNISELIVGVVVSETEDKVVLKDATFLVVANADASGKPNINFVPLEMISMQPPINVRSFVKDSSKSLEFTFYKSALINSDVELNAEIVNHYNMLVRKIQPATNTLPREKEIVKLF